MNSKERVKRVKPTINSVIRFVKHSDYYDLQVTRYRCTTFDLVSECGSASFVGCAVAGDIDKTESLPVVKQEVEDGLSIKHNANNIRMLCLEGAHRLLKLRVILSNISAHPFYSIFSLLEEHGCTIGGRDGEE